MAQDLLGLQGHRSSLPQAAQSHPVWPMTPPLANSGANNESPKAEPTSVKSDDLTTSQPPIRRQRSSQVVTKSFVIFEDPDMIRAVQAATFATVRDEARYWPNEGDGGSGKTSPQSVPSNEAATTKPASPCDIVQPPVYANDDDISSEDGDLTCERLALHQILPENIPERCRVAQWMDRVTMPSIAAMADFCSSSSRIVQWMNEVADIFEFVDPSSSEDAHAIPSPFAAVVVDPTSPSSAGNPASTHCPNTGLYPTSPSCIRPHCRNTGAAEEGMQRGLSEEQHSLQTIATRLSQSIRTMSGSVKESPAVYGSMLSDLIAALHTVVARHQDCFDSGAANANGSKRLY